MEHESVYEDIGYRRDMQGESNERKRKQATGELIKIEYTRGCCKGDIKWIRRDIAEDLIKRRWAKEAE